MTSVLSRRVDKLEQAHNPLGSLAVMRYGAAADPAEVDRVSDNLQELLGRSGVVVMLREFGDSAAIQVLSPLNSGIEN